jgi:hypothetical protein
MKYAEAKKKHQKIAGLMAEYNLLKATIRAIDRSNKESKVDLTPEVETQRGLESFYDNMKRRLTKIEMEFDNLLK